ncbi:GNAT family N-acetyltransferase [Paenibacillus sp. NEAU-GSW1]|uniref:GNAT family N-acetyltransferase n=1 Tax=Paenibacillus sp. NEAU-GSW1 TaxID=2682486 RepID=UPI0012E23EA2|nr:GNAT family N-acetyltransferase [Paenibacillus sp. NEAU-GSW1]MUT67539.1 GNAT family N-acetyltransferase [Paenibacillus sp. NEAU-GSW1]
MKLMPAAWRTTNLFLKQLEAGEIEEVQEVYRSSVSLGEWVGHEYNSELVRNSFENGDLPPGGAKDNFSMQAIRHEARNEIIGFISMYHGYPNEGSIYISYMGFGAASQKKGCGQELTRQLVVEARRLGYSELRVNVSLKNWPALRFWTQAGFNQISGIFGDKVISDDHFADIELVNELS